MSSKTFMNMLLFIFTFVLPCLVGLSNGECDFEAIFNFGDSNSDTGGFYAAFPAETGPYGMTYFNKPAGRASDGRLVIDFIGNSTIYI
ncbi:GDSL esterase/lipase [Trifolium pratense]|uniref:GDSL esterase/lipase n=1 Tax=Trifolium pratense TaxID=57577 RepID=A0A2K3LZ84_TRIPR|nr:GDSL esterase/lipase [Trifolium pratense]